jgi:hypothetical protein
VRVQSGGARRQRNQDEGGAGSESEEHTRGNASGVPGVMLDLAAFSRERTLLLLQSLDSIS